MLLEIWHKVNSGAEDKINIKNMQANIASSRVCKIKSNKIKFFNQFDKEEVVGVYNL